MKKTQVGTLIDTTATEYKQQYNNCCLSVDKSVAKCFVTAKVYGFVDCLYKTGLITAIDIPHCIDDMLGQIGIEML